MTAGRPTSYKPEMCDLVVPFMAQGYSTGALAGHLGVARSTVWKWMDEHPAFSDAVKEGMSRSQQFWEKTLIENAIKGEGNATSAIFGLKNRASEDWHDRKDVNYTSSDGTMTPKPALDLSQLPSEALKAIVDAADGQAND
jgi:hypothetical protein